jgi:hypothetical protein
MSQKRDHLQTGETTDEFFSGDHFHSTADAVNSCLLEMAHRAAGVLNHVLSHGTNQQVAVFSWTWQTRAVPTLTWTESFRKRTCQVTCCTPACPFILGKSSLEKRSLISAQTHMRLRRKLGKLFRKPGKRFHTFQKTGETLQKTGETFAHFSEKCGNLRKTQIGEAFSPTGLKLILLQGQID